jgi:hypothetical protein
MMIRAHTWHGCIPLLGGMLLGLAMMGCVTQDPFRPPVRDEIPDGPGLFTGRRGAWVISRQVGAQPAQPGADDPQATKPSVPQATPSVSPSVTPSLPGVTPSVPATPRPKAPPM